MTWQSPGQRRIEDACALHIALTRPFVTGPSPAFEPFNTTMALDAAGAGLDARGIVAVRRRLGRRDCRWCATVLVGRGWDDHEDIRMSGVSPGLVTLRR